MSFPLITTGPGGIYTTRFIPRGSRLLAVCGDQTPQDAEGEADRRSTQQHSADPRSARQRRGIEGATSPGPAPAVAPQTLLDRLLGIDRVVLSPQPVAAAAGSTGEPIVGWPGSTALTTAARAWLKGQLTAIGQLHRFFEQLCPRLAIAPVGWAVRPCVFDVVRATRTIAIQENPDESHSQAAANPPNDPGVIALPMVIRQRCRSSPRNSVSPR